MKTKINRGKGSQHKNLIIITIQVYLNSNNQLNFKVLGLPSNLRQNNFNINQSKSKKIFKLS